LFAVRRQRKDEEFDNATPRRIRTNFGVMFMHSIEAFNVLLEEDIIIVGVRNGQTDSTARRVFIFYFFSLLF